MDHPYQTTQQAHAGMAGNGNSCTYCLEGKCEERRMLGLCGCGRISVPQTPTIDSGQRSSEESELVIKN